MVFGMVIPLAIVMGLGALIATAVFVITRIRAGEPLSWSFRTILVAYFHLMSIVSVIVLALGLTTLLKAGLSDAFGREFSYWMPAEIVKPAQPRPAEPGNGTPAPREPSPQELEEQRQRELRRIEQQYRNDLLQGGTLAVVGLILWPLHAWGRRRISQADDAWLAFFSRMHLTILLLLFSLVGIISLPMSVYQLLRFFLLPMDEFGSREPPGESVATALVFVPLWVFFLISALRQMRGERTAPATIA